jgi:hypothetical protein
MAAISAVCLKSHTVFTSRYGEIHNGEAICKEKVFDRTTLPMRNFAVTNEKPAFKPVFVSRFVSLSTPSLAKARLASLCSNVSLLLSVTPKVAVSPS